MTSSQHAAGDRVTSGRQSFWATAWRAVSPVRREASRTSSSTAGNPTVWAARTGSTALSSGRCSPSAPQETMAQADQRPVAAASVTMAPLGARTAHRLPVDKLKRIFAVILYFLAAYMLWKAAQ